MTLHPIAYAKVKCCRTWNIVWACTEGMCAWGECGLCRQRPELVEGSVEWPTASP